MPASYRLFGCICRGYPRSLYRPSVLWSAVQNRNRKSRRDLAIDCFSRTRHGPGRGDLRYAHRSLGKTSLE